MTGRVSADGFDPEHFDAVHERGARAAQNLWQRPLSAYGGGA